MADQQYQYREDALALFKGTTNFGDYFGSMKPGETFKQPELAETLNASPIRAPKSSIMARPLTCWSRKCRRTKA